MTPSAVAIIFSACAIVITGFTVSLQYSALKNIKKTKQILDSIERDAAMKRHPSASGYSREVKRPNPPKPGSKPFLLKK